MDLGNRLWDSWQHQISGDAKGGKADKANKSNTTSSSMFNEFFYENRGKGKQRRGSKDSLSPSIMGHSKSTSAETTSNNNATDSNSTHKMFRSKSAFSNNDITPSSDTPGSSYADKFMERIISMAIPTTTTSSKRELDRVLSRIEMQKSRPQLSIQIMSRNAILLLQRLSIPFETIDLIINFINWKNPIVTITGMLFLTLCILKPINFLTLPIFYICFEIIIPAYMIQNPNTDNSVDDWQDELAKPVNEFSREFLLNVTDLQNHMLLYVNSWDFVNSWCWKLFYFRDEMLTWFIFISLLTIGLIIETFGMNFIITFFPLIKLSMVIFSWVLIISLHPTNRIKILETFYSEELRLKTMSLLNNYESKIINDLDLKLDEMEVRQIEIFELQYYNDELKAWQFCCYSKDIYPPNSHIRLNNLPIEGTSTLESIVAPDGWKFINTSDLINDDLNELNDSNNLRNQTNHSSIASNNDNNDTNDNTNGNNTTNNNNNANHNDSDNNTTTNNNNNSTNSSRSSSSSSSSNNNNNNENQKDTTENTKNNNFTNTSMNTTTNKSTPTTNLKKGRPTNRTFLLFDYEKKRILKEKKKYQKYLKKYKKNHHRQDSSSSFSQHKRTRSQGQEFIIEDNTDSSLLRRRVSHDFHNILIDPLTLNRTIVEQLATGVDLEGWNLDLCPHNWVVNNYLQSVLDIDDETKWVYDLVVMGNGVNAYSAGLGVTTGKLKRSRGDVRRRRWVRYAVREVVQGIQSDEVVTDEEEEEEDDDDEEETETDSNHVSEGYDEDEYNKQNNENSGNDYKELDSDSNDDSLGKGSRTKSDEDNGLDDTLTVI